MTALAWLTLAAIALAALAVALWDAGAEMDAHVEAVVAERDVLDAHLAETPLYAETCAAEAARIARAELDADLARLMGGQR